MRAIRVHEHGGPEVMRLEEIATPVPIGTQVLIRVHAAGVNPVDTYIRAGAYTGKTLPYTPGFDCAGVVEANGNEARRFKKGDRVYTSSSLSGTYADYALCDETTLHPLPENISFDAGSALGIPYATAYRAMYHRAKVVPGETLLVHGASGGVGIAAVQFARAAGIHVIGTSSTARGRELVLKNGADLVLDHSSAGYSEELLRVTEGRGVDVILEMLANVNLGRDLTLLAKSGRVVVIGSRGKVEINPRDTMARDASIHGMMLFNAAPEEIRSIHAGIYAGLQNGSLRPVVGRQFSLTEAPQAHVAVLEPGAYGKIVLLP